MAGETGSRQTDRQKQNGSLTEKPVKQFSERKENVDKTSAGEEESGSSVPVQILPAPKMNINV